MLTAGVGWGGVGRGVLVLTCTAQLLSMSILGRECLKGGRLANLEGKHLRFTATAPGGRPWYLEPVSGSHSGDSRQTVYAEHAREKGILEALDAGESRTRVVK